MLDITISYKMSEIVRNLSENCKFVQNSVRNMSEIFCPKDNVRKFDVRNLTVKKFL